MRAIRILFDHHDRPLAGDDPTIEILKQPENAVIDGQFDIDVVMLRGGTVSGLPVVAVMPDPKAEPGKPRVVIYFNATEFWAIARALKGFNDRLPPDDRADLRCEHQ